LCPTASVSAENVRTGITTRRSLTVVAGREE